MTKQQKALAAVAAISFTLLYFTGLLWPLVRFVTAATAVAALASSYFFCVRYYLTIQKHDLDANAKTQILPRLIASCAVTIGSLILFTLVPIHAVPPAFESNVAGRGANQGHENVGQSTSIEPTFADTTPQMKQYDTESRLNSVTRRYDESTEAPREWAGVDSKVRDAMQGQFSENQIELEQRKMKILAEKSGMQADEVDRLLKHALDNPLIRKD